MMGALNLQQKAQLSEPLNRAHVKERTQSGRSFSYIEGWHAIAEANRIFEYDGWTRETLELRCVMEAERKVGRDQVPGWGVTYIARVRVVVAGIIREGSGAGHGIDRDLGLAHESALKEAETDAMKRALMTFGNPFGLALYDKEQAGVTGEAPVPAARPASPSAAATSRARKETPPAPAPAEGDAYYVKTVYGNKAPYAAVFDDGKKCSFFSETLLGECKDAQALGFPVRRQTEERWKDGRKYENLKAIWPVDAGLQASAPPEDEPPPPTDADVEPF